MSIEELTKRVTDLENSLKVAKMAAGAFGVSFVLLFGYVTHLKNTAEEVTREVIDAKKNAISEIEDVTDNFSSIKESALDELELTRNQHSDVLEERTDQLKVALTDKAESVFGKSCKELNTSKSCYDKSWQLSCGKNGYIARITNVGGDNSCIKSVLCCSVDVN